ncbi:MAG: hypothetical protein AB8B96_18685, partial [Lysobacterales bacterium]
MRTSRPKMPPSELPRASAYSEGDWDQAIGVSLRSDPVFVVSRVFALAVMFWLMARAINHHQVSAALLLIPFTAHWLAMLWTGLVLSGWVVRCPAFRNDYFRPVKVTIMTALLAAMLLTLMRFDSSVDAVNDGSLWQMMAANLMALKKSGLWIVVLIEILGVALWVWPDIRRWQQKGGKFVWQASIQRGVSAAAMFFLAIAAVFTVPWFVDGVEWSNLS